MRCSNPLQASALSLLLAAGALAVGCGSADDDSASGDAAVSAVATTTQVADFARRVGGDRVAVHQILQPDSDPHGFEPRPSDAAALADADVVFRSGGEVDAWTDDLVTSASGDPEVVDLIDSVETTTGSAHDHGHADQAGDGHGDRGEEHADEEGHASEEHADEEQAGEGDHAAADDEAGEHEGEAGGEVDPHWWQSPANAELAVERVAAALGQVDPDGARAYERNAARYGERLRELDRAVAACIERIPADRRELVTTHGALGYYADRYGLELVGALIPSLSTAAQPSARDIRELVEQIRAEDVRAIFPESSVSPELEQAVARETGARIGDPLWADTLGPEGSDGETYVESIESNTDAIAEGLTDGEVTCFQDA